MTGGAWARWTTETADRVRATGRWRLVRDLDGPGPEAGLHGPHGDRPVVSFAGNDYLGLARHPAVLAAAHAALDRWGAGATAARLLAGARPVHRELEVALADWKGTDAAVLFPTGYTANLGVLAVLGQAGVRIVSDERNHASIIDGCRLSRAEVVVTPHADVDAVDRALAGAGGRALVVTESVFSMDGDAAPVHELVEVCGRRGALLLVDEAHAVLGPALAGADHVVRIGTLSKMLVSMGGFVAGPSAVCDLLVNLARPFIFTTASPPSAAAAALAALGVVRSPEGDTRRARLRANIDDLAPGHPSAVVPVMVGGEADALAASDALLEAGLFVPAIRPPTVPPGACRLRISLSAAHTPAHVAALARALAALVPAGAVPA